MKHADTFEWSRKNGSFFTLALKENVNLSIKTRCAAEIKLQHQRKEVIPGKLTNLCVEFTIFTPQWNSYIWWKLRHNRYLCVSETEVLKLRYDKKT